MKDGLPARLIREINSLKQIDDEHVVQFYGSFPQGTSVGNHNHNQIHFHFQLLFVEMYTMSRLLHVLLILLPRVHPLRIVLI